MNSGRYCSPMLKESMPTDSASSGSSTVLRITWSPPTGRPERSTVTGRTSSLDLSRAGEQLIRRTEGAMAAAEGDLLAPLDEQQREQFYTLLRRLADGVELCPTADRNTCAH